MCLADLMGLNREYGAHVKAHYSDNPEKLGAKRVKRQQPTTNTRAPPNRHTAVDSLDPLCKILLDTKVLPAINNTGLHHVREVQSCLSGQS